MDGAGYEERPPAPALARTVACTWTGRVAADGGTYADRVLPDGCVDLVWDGVRLVVAGPDTGPVRLAAPPGTTYAGIRFRPGLASPALGLPASALRDQRVEAVAVLGRAGHRLLDPLAAAPSPRAAAAVLEAAVEGWVRGGPPPDPLVEAAVAALARPVATPVATLADRLGVGERQLLRRCTAAVGYGPKVLDRVLRFRRFLSLAERAEPGGLVGLAVRAGYHDQAHLSRECRRLSGLTPAALVGPWPTSTDVRSVQDAGTVAGVAVGP